MDRRPSFALRAAGAAGLLALAAAPGCSRPAATAKASISVAVPYELTSLDPHAENTISSFAVLSNVYEPLVTTDPDMAVRPGLAETWETPDPMTWVFHIRPGIRFHSGRPLRAADVVYSLDRLLRDPSLEMRSYLLNVSTVRETAPLTVEVRTLRPSRLLSKKLNFVLIVPEGTTTATLAGAADGTGPYSLRDWRPGDRVRLQGNEDYWGTRPEVQDVELCLARTPDDAIDGLLSGRHQLVQANSKRLEERVRSSPRHQVLRQENIFVKYLAYDLSREVTAYCSVTPNPFKDPRVRRAIHLGIDRRRLAADLPNEALPATQPVPRSIIGFNPSIPEVVPDADPARSLLKQAGLRAGFSVVLHTRRILLPAAELVREELAPLGIRVEVRALPDAEFFDALNRRDASFWLSRWGCPTGDASDLLEALVHSPDRSRHFGQNNSYAGAYSNPKMDRAIEASGQMEGTEERRKALQQIMKSLMDELVLIPLYADQDGYGIEISFAWRPRSDSYVRAADIRIRR